MARSRGKRGREAAAGTQCLAEAARALGPGLCGAAALRAAVDLLIDEVVSALRGEGATVPGREGGRGLGCPAESAARVRLRAGILATSRPDAYWLGEAYQVALDEVSGSRRMGGVFYTPEALVGHVVERAFGLLGDGVPGAVLDPACGCGGFLVEAGRRMVGRAARGEIAGRLYGVDIDPLAAALCRLALWVEFGNHAALSDTPERFGAQVRCADALLGPRGEGAFDLVLGNPPFLSQLASGTARDREQQRRLRARFGASVRAYTDPAALFLHEAVELVRPGGVAGMVLPGSVLAARDAEPVRRHVAERASVRSLWLDTDGIFDAAVSTVAVTVVRDGDTGVAMDRFTGSGFARAPSLGGVDLHEDSWGGLAADLLGVPRVRLGGDRTLGDFCEITAGFRDEYYAIAGVVTELAEGEPGADSRMVVSAGMIEPARLEWGARASKIAGRAWLRPGVRVGEADGAGEAVVGDLVRRQSHPKLLVATQTRVIEAAPDPGGRAVALTPVITVAPRDPADLWRVGAVLSSPASSAWLAARSFGTARSLRAIKPSAAGLRAMPAPVDWRGWDRAAAAYRRACESQSAEGRRGALVESAGAALAAAGVGGSDAEKLLAWWVGRLSGRDRPGAVRSRSGAASGRSGRARGEPP